MSDVIATPLQSMFSELLDLHDKTWANLSKASSIVHALIADDHIHVIGEENTLNLIFVIEDLIDLAKIGVEKNFELIRQHKNTEELIHE